MQTEWREPFEYPIGISYVQALEKLFDKKRQCSYWSYEIKSEDQLFRYRRRTAEKCKRIFVFICEVGMHA